MNIFQDLKKTLFENVSHTMMCGINCFNYEDLCTLLGTDSSDDILDDDEYFTKDGAVYVYPAGLFHLIGSCELPLDEEIRKQHPAYKYQRWLFHDVLPTIRKTGFYNFAAE